MDLASVAAAGRAAYPGSPSWDGTAVRDEAAAAALGLTSRQASVTTGSAGGGGGASGPGGSGSSFSGRRRGDVAQTFKSFGGAVRGMAKDVASASRSQLKSLAGGGGMGGGGGGRNKPGMVTAAAGISDGAPQLCCATGSQPAATALCLVVQTAHRFGLPESLLPY